MLFKKAKNTKKQKETILKTISKFHCYALVQYNLVNSDSK